MGHLFMMIIICLSQCRVDLKFPQTEIRFQDLKVDAYAHEGSRALPTIPNFIFNMTEALLRQLKILPGRQRQLSILNNISGIIRPSRMTLLLGPPGSGKTTLLLALAGRLDNGFEKMGSITYNGKFLKDFVPQTTSAYVSQKDWFVPEMTVRETLEFAGHCQGVGSKYGMFMELTRREKNAGIKPDEDLDIFMKALALAGEDTSLIVEYIMKILCLDICADILVGDEMLKGISGGQKKRLSTGEIVIGPARVLLMDEITTGLDSSTAYEIIKYLRHLTHAFDGTTLISLLQPTPELYELFDDVILICEGQIIYQGPRAGALEFFALMGFKCPKRKNVADFLQEVTSVKDQQQYWSVPGRPYQYVPVMKFAEAFCTFHIGQSLSRELAHPYDRRCNHPTSLSMYQYGVGRAELLKASFKWQVLLMKRNLFIYIFKLIQILFVAVITMTVFFRTNMHHRTIDDGVEYLGAIYFSTIIILFNGFTEVALLIAKLPVLYKHRDLHFYPCWVYSFPSWALSIPTSLVESAIWVIVTYYAMGFDPQITRFLHQLLLYFSLHQMSLPLFRLMASLGRNMIVANTFGSFALLIIMALGGFILSKDSIPSWWRWGYWFSPMMYAQNAVSLNEFLGDSWNKKVWKYTNASLGEEVLRASGLLTDGYWYWIGLGTLLGYTVIFNILLTISLNLLDPLRRRQAVISNQEMNQKKKVSSFELRTDKSLGLNFKGQRGMVLPFKPVSMCFRNINYNVDVPLALRRQGILEDRLQLLANVTGAFRPGVLTALVGVSGAGKTTLMDVLSGRKTGGLIEGSITINGHPKKQETFARIAGYCEQDDIHSPCMTVHESLIYSAWLRLPSYVDLETQKVFVDEVMDLVELTSLCDALVGQPGVDGLSTEQRKRLTIATELVANPSIVFMDEPTSGLDARAAAIVMRTVRNIVDTGRTIVCTVHQPSIDIFESFDELLFMKQGGELIYAGPLGTNSKNLIEYLESIDGVPKMKAGYNPATWMLEVTSPAKESQLGTNFGELYRKSSLFQKNNALVESLLKLNTDSDELTFPTKYSQPFRVQFLACLWKQNRSYWRNPQYTAVRFFYTIIVSLILGTICWKSGSKRGKQQDVSNAMGSMYAAVIFMGITNATAVQPVVSTERLVSYRERAAGMYSALPFALAQVVIEFPYVFVQTLIYGTLFYFMASFEWDMKKFFSYLFFMYFTLLYFTFFGMMTSAITPNQNIAPIVAAPFYMLWNLFCGFVISHKSLPGWWRWYYWANPMSWSLYGLLTSQYGNMDEPIKIWDGSHSMSIRHFLEHYFGFRQDFLGLSGFMVIGFTMLFALIFAFAIKSLNFQKR